MSPQSRAKNILFGFGLDDQTSNVRRGLFSGEPLTFIGKMTEHVEGRLKVFYCLMFLREIKSSMNKMSRINI